MKRLVRRQGLLDALMGAGAFAFGLLELSGTPAVVAPRPVIAALLAVQTLPVAFRRRAPLAVFLVVGTADLSSALPLWNGAPLDLAAASYLCLQLANYTVSAHHSRTTGIGAAAALIGGVLVAMGVTGQSFTDAGWLLLFLIIPTFAVALAGGYIRERRLAAAALEERARALEADRDASARRAAADERARIARELHDVVAHSVSVMVVQAGAARRIVGDDPDRAREALRSIEVTGRDALSELRRLLGVLRRDEPSALAPQPGLAQLGPLVERFREAGLDVQLTAALDGRALPPGADLSAYRVVQEALTNTLKHARARSARVAVRGDADGVEVEVVDDGVGAASVDRDGKGLIGMRERVAFFGGDFRAGPRAAGGYAVWARFPFPSE